MIPKLLSVLFALSLVNLASQAMALGTITMSSSGDATNGVTITVNVFADPGGQPGPLPCSKLGVTRGYGGPIVGMIQRQAGDYSAQVVDTGVLPNQNYCYRVVLLGDFIGTYCNFGDINSICSVFDCFCDVSTCINTGPGAAFLGHGFLSTQNADLNETQAILYPCSGDLNSPIMGLHTVSGTAAQYVDSGIAVDLYGVPWCCWAQCMWLTSATAATPHSCVVSSENTSWGAVKSRYKN